MIRWIRKLRASRHVMGAVRDADNINVEIIARLFTLDVAIIHKICAKYVKQSCLQRLHNTPGIDYYPIGFYGGMLRLPHADGAKNPFLDKNGNLQSALLPPRSRNENRSQS